MKDTTKKASKAIAYILIILLLIGSIGLIFALTNGFSEDFKTFYLVCGDEEIVKTETNRDFRRDEVYRFDVKYVFDTEQTNPKDYSVKVITNAEREFTFTVDNDNYSYQSGLDLSSVFELTKEKTYFTFKIPKDMTLQTVLERIYPDKDVVVKNASILTDNYLYSLIVTSYNEKVTYKINFRLRTQVTGVEFDPTELLF